METTDLQKKIKALIQELKWSQKQLAREIYISRNEFDDENEIIAFQESLKKQLNRKTTSAELLQGYIKVIYQHPQFLKQKPIRNEYIDLGTLPINVAEGLRDISLKLNDVLIEEENQDFEEG